MTFKNLMVLLQTYPEPTPLEVVEASVDVARALTARLSALCIVALPRAPVSALGTLVLDIPALVADEHRKLHETAHRLLADFRDRAMARAVLCKEILETCEGPDFPDVLAGYTRLYDLTIAAMPGGSYLSHFDAHWYAEAVIFDSGRPAIIIPHERRRTGPLALDNVIVAWDHSRAAARTVADALPILVRARSNLVVTVTGEKQLRDDHAPDALLQHLALHGVDATHRSLSAEGRGVGDVLADCARMHNADLIVMGAYGTSRFREFVLGGATKSLLSHSQVPLFMSH